MYVIYPAEELLKVYESSTHSTNFNDNLPNTNSTKKIIKTNEEKYCPTKSRKLSTANVKHCPSGKNRNSSSYKENKEAIIKGIEEKDSADFTKSLIYYAERGKFNKPITVQKNKKIKNYLTMQSNRSVTEDSVNPLKELIHINLNEPLKQHNGDALKLIQTVSEFAHELGVVVENHGSSIRRLVDEFRRRCFETRGDIGGMKKVWESLLRQVETDATNNLDLATLLKQLSRPTLEASFPKKLQSRKVFAHREAYEQVISKSEENLQITRIDYKRAYDALLKCNNIESGLNAESESYNDLQRAYIEAHNAYILQLHSRNALNEYYQTHCLPGLLGEISTIYEELNTLACNCIASISEATGKYAFEQSKRYQLLTKEAQTINSLADLQLLAKNLLSSTSAKKPSKRLFVPPCPPDQIPPGNAHSIAILKNEIVQPESATAQRLLDDLCLESDELTSEIGRLRDSLDALTRVQRKSVEGSLFSKVAELQDDISQKRYDLGAAHLRLVAVQAQKELFGTSDMEAMDGANNRKMSNGSTGSTKHKWLKAFKSLKTTTPNSSSSGEKSNKQAMYHAVSTVVAMSRKNFETEGGHQWREYTYRNITPCNACGQVLRGHSRQGLRCRACKLNAHVDCINIVQPSNCPSLAPKRTGGIPLLRRQKTSSAPHVDDCGSVEHNVDATYQVLKQAGEIRGNSTNSPPTPPILTDHTSTSVPLTLAKSSSTIHPSSSSTSGYSGARSASGTRPFGQPLVLIAQNTTPDLSSNTFATAPPSRYKRIVIGKN